MHNIPSQLHFPADIKLKERPLAEAWLEMRWQLQPIKPPHVMVDPDFAFALGAFYNSVRAFDLAVPKGTGTVLIASGLHKSETPDSRNVIEKQVIVWQLEVVSGGVCVSDCL